MKPISPTADTDVNEVLSLLLANVKEILQDQFIGMYLYGSLSSGDFNPETSDIDFLVVTTDTLSGETIAKLEVMHNRTWATSLKRAGKLEGAYVPKELIRKHNLNGSSCPTINEGKFFVDKLGSDWIIQRHVIREYGVVIEGPNPKTLIDFVSPDDIRSAVMGTLRKWWFPMLDDPTWLRNGESGDRAFAVITMCRVLHALEHGKIVSKPKAIQWAQAKLGEPWKTLIDQAVAVSQHKEQDISLNEILDFIRFTKEQTMNSISPTPHSGVNEILNILYTNARAILQDHFVGMYLHGSLTNGGFDKHSDIDVIFVTSQAIPDEIFAMLTVMHKDLTKTDSPWANQLEVAYIPQVAFERFDTSILYPHLDRGVGETLHKIAPESDWPILCHTLRESGITILGPDLKTLIDPIAPSDLKQAVMEGVPIWFAPIIANPVEIKKRGYQSFFVITICRMLYTLKYGEIISKPAATQWGKEQLDQQWQTLIERAWLGRQTPDLEANSDDIHGTLEMMHYIMNYIDQLK